MSRGKRKQTASEKQQKNRLRGEYVTIFVKGKQKRVKRPATVDGLDVHEFILRNADPIWLHQCEMWEYMGSPPEAPEEWRPDGAQTHESSTQSVRINRDDDDDEIPF